jgi:aminoglycoside phosphotransferase (APT) family kinase protein
MGRRIGSGSMAEVFEAGADVLKLYRAGYEKYIVDHEAGILAALAPLELPVPLLRGVVEIDGRWGLLMSRAEGQPLSAQLRPDDIEKIADGVALLHTRLHAQPGTGLGSYQARLTRDIGGAAGLDDTERQRLLQRLAELPQGDRLCHGDFHPANIMGSLDRPMIVDWLDGTSGPPAADAGRSYLLLLHNFPGMAEPYLDAYGRHSGMARSDVLDWLPVLAAARLSENIPAETERLVALARGGGVS